MSWGAINVLTAITKRRRANRVRRIREPAPNRDEQGSVVALREQVVPRISQAPGFVAGYWTRKGNSGLLMSVWESEDAANTASEMVKSVAPEGVTVDSVEVREAVASA